MNDLEIRYAGAKLAADSAEEALAACKKALDAAEAEVARLTARAGELHEALRLMVHYLQEEASEGDGIREEHWDGYQAAEVLLNATESDQQAWTDALIKNAENEATIARVREVIARMQAQMAVDEKTGSEFDAGSADAIWWYSDELLDALDGSEGT